MSQTIQGTPIKVWDPIVRYGHWALAPAFAVAYLSAEGESGGPDQLHVCSGYIVGLIVAIRILWGLNGPRHARFSDFAYSPILALRYSGDLVRGQARRYLGHSPIGAAMVVALLVCLTGTVGTGLAAYGNIGKGPLADRTVIVTASAHAEYSEGRRGEGGGSALGELHSVLSTMTLGLWTYPTRY